MNVRGFINLKIQVLRFRGIDLFLHFRQRRKILKPSENRWVDARDEPVGEADRQLT